MKVIEMRIDLLNESRYPLASRKQRGSMQRELSVPKIKNNCVNNNATVSENTCGRVSFKGTPASEAAEAAATFTDRIVNKIRKSRKLQDMLESAVKNNLIAESIFALIVTCTARPATLLAFPTKKPEDKLKNRYAAAKSVASGIVGFVATYAIAEPFKPIVEQTMRNFENKFVPEKLLKPVARYMACEKLNIEIDKDTLEKATPEMIERAKKIISDIKLNSLFDEAKNAFTEATNQKKQISILTELIAGRLRNESKTMQAFVSKIHLPASLPLKAMATIALVPIILNVFGIRKKSNDKSKEQKSQQNIIPPQTNLKPVFKNINKAGRLQK